jgi:hypothetical protein
MSPFSLAEALGIGLGELRAIETEGTLTFDLAGRILSALDFPPEALFEANHCLVRLEEYASAGGAGGQNLETQPLAYLLQTGYHIFNQSIGDLLEGQEALGPRKAAAEISRSAQRLALLAQERIGGPDDPLEYARQISEAVTSFAELLTVRRIASIAGECS